VRVAMEGGAREDGTIVQARVVEPVGEDLRRAVRERREDAQVGRVAAGEEERARQAGEVREGRLRLLVKARVPDNDGRGAGAEAEGVDGAMAAARIRGWSASPR